MNTTTLAAQKVTIYFEGGFGYSKVEAREWSTEIGSYAQYTAAITCHFIGKGQRNRRGFVQTYKPTLVILEGWGHMDPAEKFTAPVASGSGCTVSRGRFSACSPEWGNEFSSALSAYVKKTGVRVLANFHGHNPHGAVAQAAAVA